MKQLKRYAEAKISRRKFLSGGVILSASAVAVAVAPKAAVAAAANTESVVENNKEEGYRLTKHIADYYKSAAL